MIGTVLDIETTGFLKFNVNDKGDSVLSDDSEILEVGFLNIDMETRRICTSGTLYFYKPYFNIESDAQRIHGLQRDFLQQYENDFDMNLVALNSLIQSTCLIGKNSDKFDIPFIHAFINKHVGRAFDIPAIVSELGMKGYNGGYVGYSDTLYALDMQTLYKERWRDLHYKRTGLMPLSSKKGTLTDYIEDIPYGREATDAVYSSLKKDRETGAHGALYDACMTYVVWCDARNADVC